MRKSVYKNLFFILLFVISFTVILGFIFWNNTNDGSSNTIYKRDKEFKFLVTTIDTQNISKDSLMLVLQITGDEGFDTGGDKGVSFSFGADDYTIANWTIFKNNKVIADSIQAKIVDNGRSYSLELPTEIQELSFLKACFEPRFNTSELGKFKEHTSYRTGLNNGLVGNFNVKEIKLNYYYQAERDIQIQGNKINTTPVVAIYESNYGIIRGDYFFNPQKGFVKMEYRMPNHELKCIELIE
jgi:hypothetical protein